MPVLDSWSAPTLTEMAELLRRLINEDVDREMVAEWAGRWVSLKNPPIPDPKLWTAIERLSGADMITTDRPYLYEKEDFARWLSELLASD